MIKILFVNYVFNFKFKVFLTWSTEYTKIGEEIYVLKFMKWLSGQGFEGVGRKITFQGRW